MAEVRLTAAAVESLDRLILTNSLPADTRARVKRSLRILERFPRIGRELEGAWKPLRFILGPWRWLLVVYDYAAAAELVLVVSFQDARSSTAATSAPGHGWVAADAAATLPVCASSPPHQSPPAR